MLGSFSVVSKSSDNKKKLTFKKKSTRGLMRINNAKVQKITRKRVTPRDNN